MFQLSKNIVRYRWVVCAGALFLIFWLPYYVPVPPAVSDSYLFGFSNKMCQALILLFVTGFALLDSPLLLPDQADAGLERAAKPIPRSTLFAMLALVCGICGMMYLLTRGLHGYDESRYLIDRVKLLTEGQTPYRDFEFIYGPLLLYGPFAISRIFHCSVEGSYYAFWALEAILGNCLLYSIMNRLAVFSTHTRTIYLVFAVGSMTALLDTGENYTLLRFVLPAFFALLLCRSFGNGQSTRSYLQSLLLAIPFTIAIGLVSPEFGFAFAIGSLAYIAFYGIHREPMRMAAWIAAGVFLALAAYAGYRLSLFDTMKDFAGGGFNFPIIPALHILLFLFCLTVSVRYLVAKTRAKAAPAAVTLIIATALPAIPAALGRCDIEHVLFGVFGITLAGTILASRHASVWRWYRYALVVVVVFLSFFTWLLNGRSMLVKLAVYRVFASEPEGTTSSLDRRIEHVLTRGMEPEKAERKIAQLKAAAHSSGSIDLDSAFPEMRGVVWVPFGFALEGAGFYHDPRLDPGRYNGFLSVVSPQSVARKISELEDKPERQLLLPIGFEEQCNVEPANEVKTIRLLFLFPFKKKPLHMESVTAPVCSYIVDHYRLQQAATPATFGYELWAPRSN